MRAHWRNSFSDHAATRNPVALGHSDRFNEIFRAVMGTAPTADYMPLAKQWNFSGSHVVADLGGGGGSLLAAILSANPHLSGMLVDRAESIDAAGLRFENEKLGSRCKLITADLCAAIPSGADVYILKHVLHGYNDAVAGKVLENCRNVMSSEARLLVIEFVLPDVVSGPDPHLQTRLFSDLNILAVTRGKERSTVEMTCFVCCSDRSQLQSLPLNYPMPQLPRRACSC
jgi:hypothetical protein